MHVRRAVASVGAGLLLGLAFPPFDAPWVCLPAAVAIWLVAVRGMGVRHGAWLTLLFAWSFHLLLLRWMLAIGVDAWLALALLEALFLVPVGAVLGALHSPWRYTLVAIIGLPLQDWLRDHAGAVAFGWGQLAFATVEAPWMRIAPMLNQWFVTALVTALAAFAALAVHGASRVAVRMTSLGIAILLLALPLLAPLPTPAAFSSDRIAVVQPGATHTGIGFAPTPLDVLQRLSTLTRERLAHTDALLVVWPENALDLDPRRDDDARALLLGSASAIQRPILAGAVLDDGDGRHNASLLAQSGVMHTQYVKQRLVPFGEVMPLRGLMERWFERVRFVPRDFVPGTGAGSVEVGGRRLGILICFEIADEGLVRDALGAGADALILQTNNATYAGLGQSDQQLRIAQVRALMSGVPVYMVSTTGPTWAIDRTGRLVRGLDEGVEDTLLVHLPAPRLAT